MLNTINQLKTYRQGTGINFKQLVEELSVNSSIHSCTKPFTIEKIQCFYNTRTKTIL